MVRDPVPLPKGITGFTTRNKTLPSVPFALFKHVVYQAAQAVGAQVTRMATAEGKVDRNYHAAELRFADATLVIVCNAHVPWLALTGSWDVVVTGGPWKFVEHRALHGALAVCPQLQLLSTKTLEAPVTPQAVQLLDPAERHQVQGWKPKRLGDLIFNFWD